MRVKASTRINVRLSAVASGMMDRWRLKFFGGIFLIFSRHWDDGQVETEVVLGEFFSFFRDTWMMDIF